MTHPILYDFRRTISSKSVLVTMGVVILISLVLIPVIQSSAISSNGTPVGANAQILLEKDSGGFHFNVYTFNQFGQPLPGATLTIKIGGQNSPIQATTNSSGTAALIVPAQGNGLIAFSVNLSLAGRGGGGIITSRGNLSTKMGLDPLPFLSNIFFPVIDSSNSSKVDILASYEGRGGSAPTGYLVYYNFSQASQLTPGIGLNVSGATQLGTLNTYHQVFRLPRIPSNTSEVRFLMVAPNGTVIGSATFPAEIFIVASAAPSTTSLFTSFTAGIFSLIIPLMSVLVAYNSYGKDRVSGVLESVLSKPVSRFGLSLSRYASITLALAVAIAGTLLVMEAISQVLLGTLPPLDFVAVSFGALLVEAAAFAGLMLLLAHLTKSTGTLIGIGVVLWAVLDFFWGILVYAISSVLGYTPGSANYIAITIYTNFLNPAQFYIQVGSYQNNAFISSVGASTLGISPAAYGLTPLTLGVDGLAWVIVPLLVYLYISTKRD